jgi:bifunctional ADP-heptose synthase (sugar kinase/adenylyltransferase)
VAYLYWVIALFDDKTEKLIKEIWKELTVKNISYYEEEINDARSYIDPYFV